MKYSLIENGNLEFKEKVSNTLFKTISAFANYNDGKILIGVSDDGTVVGVEDERALKLSIENAINDNILPRPEYEIKDINIDKKTIVEIAIKKGRNVPYLYKGDAYRRMDTSTIKVNENELFDLLLRKRNLTYDASESSNQKLGFDELEKVLNLKLNITKADMNVLISLGLYKEGKFNIAAELLSDQNALPYSYIDLAQFGSSTSIFLDRNRYEKCSILKQYQEAIDFFQIHYKPFQVIDGFDRVNKIRIPDEAFREAIANALVHRDYLANGGIQISMYSNRIEIDSPGGLPAGITKNNYLNDLVSVPRNPVLAGVFYRIGIIELFGTGIRRIKDAYIGSDLKPNFIIEESRIKIVLPVINYSENISTEEKIINYLTVNNEINRTGVEKLLGTNKSKAVEIINRLLLEEKITKAGSGPSIKYIMK
ncbi:MAG: RNA-binding domain-containing protein [Saccharofermentanales bacterium]